MEKIDISAAVVLLIMAFVLVSVKIPNDERWCAIRRMNRLLFACYICIGVSNIITGVCGVDTQPDPVMWLAMLLVSMYQAFFVYWHMCHVSFSAKGGGEVALGQCRGDYACEHRLVLGIL